MKKYVAIALSIEEKHPVLFFILAEDHKLKYFTSEDEAEEYICKYYTKDTFFYGLLPDPKPSWKALKS